MCVKIVDPDTGEELGKNQPGEIWMRGPNVMKGYINNKQATDDTIDKDGWVHSGKWRHYCVHSHVTSMNQSNDVMVFCVIFINFIFIF